MPFLRSCLSGWCSCWTSPSVGPPVSTPPSSSSKASSDACQAGHHGNDRATWAQCYSGGGDDGQQQPDHRSVQPHTWITLSQTIRQSVETNISLSFGVSRTWRKCEDPPTQRGLGSTRRIRIFRGLWQNSADTIFIQQRAADRRKTSRPRVELREIQLSRLEREAADGGWNVSRILRVRYVEDRGGYKCRWKENVVFDLKIIGQNSSRSSEEIFHFWWHILLIRSKVFCPVFMTWELTEERGVF